MVTMLTIVSAVYFDHKIPNKENALLKNQVKLVEKEMEFQMKFNKGMIEVKSMLDSLDVPGQNVSYQNSLISDRLVDLQEIIPTKGSTINYDMYSNIVKMCVEFQDAKGELLSLDDAKSTIQEYKTALDRCQDNLTQAKRDLFIARNQ